MLNLKELNKKIADATEKANICLITEFRAQFPAFEKTIVETAEAGTRTGVYRFTFSENWRAHDVHTLVENELTACYKPMVFNILTVDLDTQSIKPYIRVEFIIPGINPNHNTDDYGYRMDEREEEI